MKSFNATACLDVDRWLIGLDMEEDDNDDDEQNDDD